MFEMQFAIDKEIDLAKTLSGHTEIKIKNNRVEASSSPNSIQARLKFDWAGIQVSEQANE